MEFDTITLVACVKVACVSVIVMFIVLWTVVAIEHWWSFALDAVLFWRSFAFVVFLFIRKLMRTFRF